MELIIMVQIDGEDMLAGRLFQNVRHGEETTSFSYDAGYLANPKAFAFGPDMPLVAGSFHSSGLKNLQAFEDCMPDRWGRNLLLRGERICAREEQRAMRTLFEADMLAGVNDETRQGALRVLNTEGKILSGHGEGVPREVNIPKLLDSADRAANDMDADIRDLLAAGSSLGGARPKASILDEHGALCIAKFPKVNEGSLEDVCAWENVCLQLMRLSGIIAPQSRLLRIGGRSVLLVERFDRSGEVRVPYMSGLTAVQGFDGEHYSYLELVDLLESEGAAPEEDIKELWRRALFSCAIGNVDNHLRNYGFLRRQGGWRISPVFDVNPTVGAGEKYLNTAIDFGRYEADPRIAIEACEYYRLTKESAVHEAKKMAKVLSGWRKIARQNGISESSIESMAVCFDGGVACLENAG